jgi:hypothetical protein
VAILGLSAAFAAKLGVRNATPRNPRLRKRFVFMIKFAITVLLSLRRSLYADLASLPAPRKR